MSSLCGTSALPCCDSLKGARAEPCEVIDSMTFADSNGAFVVPLESGGAGGSERITGTLKASVSTNDLMSKHNSYTKKKKSTNDLVNSTVNDSMGEEQVETVHWVDSKAFHIIIGLAITLNALQLGIELDVPLGITGEVFENLFCALWLLEMILKLLVHGREYFVFGNSNGSCTLNSWNLLDFVLAWLTVVDVWILQNLDTDGSASLKSVSVLRALRLVRLVRLVKALRMFQELWLLVNGLVQAFSLLSWVFLLFAIIIYVGAICVTTVIGKNCDDPEFQNDFSNCNDLFGTLLQSMMTLFQLITFDSWSNVVRTVASAHPAMVLFFLLFLLLTSFGLMNIVMGVIVEQTIEHAHQNEDKLAREREIKQAQELQVLKQIFEEADEDGGGSVSLEEFIVITQSRKDVQGMFKDLNLPVNRERLARRLFEVLDGNMQGDVQIEEFLAATMRLKSEGRQLMKDQTLLLMETRHLARRLTRIEKRLGTEPSNIASTSTQVSKPQVTQAVEKRVAKSPKQDSPQTGGLVLQVNDGGKVQVNQALGTPRALQDQEGGTSADLRSLKSFIQVRFDGMQSQMSALQAQVSTLEGDMKGMRTQVRHLDEKLHGPSPSPRSSLGVVEANEVRIGGC